MNHIAGISSLRNSYFIIRHGHAESNLQKILVGSPENGTTGYGLTSTGRQQAEESARQNAERLGKNILIYSSDFCRAKETAEIVNGVVGANGVSLTHLLRERYFGRFEKRPSETVHYLWEMDAKDPTHKTGGIESPVELMERVTMLVYELEQKYSGEKILVVSHGDPLQVLQAAFLKESPGYHNKIKYIKNAEIRKLELK